MKSLFGTYDADNALSLCKSQLAFVCVVYPAVVISYLGQAAYLWVHPENVSSTFYDSTPDPVYWPMFCIALLAAIVASQARMQPSPLHRCSTVVTFADSPRCIVGHHYA